MYEGAVCICAVMLCEATMSIATMEVQNVSQHLGLPSLVVLVQNALSNIECTVLLEMSNTSISYSCAVQGVSSSNGTRSLTQRHALTAHVQAKEKA